VHEKVAPGAGDAGGPGKVSSEDLSSTKIAPASKARREHNFAAVRLLAETWPRCFAIDGKRRPPLKIGITEDILAAAPDALTPDELTAALRFYCGNISYLRACVEGADRIDLDGNVAGQVTEREAEYARKIIARRQQKANCKIFNKPEANDKICHKPKATAKISQSTKVRAELEANVNILHKPDRVEADGRKAAPPKRSSLADLKRAAQQRRMAVTS
jgi:ProP effector